MARFRFFVCYIPINCKNVFALEDISKVHSFICVLASCVCAFLLDSWLWSVHYDKLPNSEFKTALIQHKLFSFNSLPIFSERLMRFWTYPVEGSSGSINHVGITSAYIMLSLHQVPRPACIQVSAAISSQIQLFLGFILYYLFGTLPTLLLLHFTPGEPIPLFKCSSIYTIYTTFKILLKNICHMSIYMSIMPTIL